MPDIEVLWARAPTLEKLEKELSRLLTECAADEVLGISHSSRALHTKQSGGIWAGATLTHKLEYSAIVLVRGH
jgi:hypothetical protein